MRKCILAVLLMVGTTFSVDAVANDLENLISKSPWIRSGGASKWVFRSGGELSDIRQNGPITTTYSLSYSINEKSKTITYQINSARAEGIDTQPDISSVKGRSYTVPYEFRGSSILVVNNRVIFQTSK